MTPGEVTPMDAPFDVWQLLVFNSEVASGSPTAVIFPPAPLTAEQCMRIAGAIGVPDTVFLVPCAGEAEWSARFFSAAEELSVCTQSLIAAHRVLDRRRSGTPSPVNRFQTRSGPITVSVEPNLPDVAWVTGPFRVLPRRPRRSPLHGSAPEILVDTGRTRLFHRVDNVEALAAVKLEPEEVMAWCRGEQASGICIFAKTGLREIAMRAFTTSLDGAEDISTGGAAMGLLPCLAAFDPKTRVGQEIWTVNQGCGPLHRRGTMVVRMAPGENLVAVGGRHLFVSRGEILSSEGFP